MGTADVRSIATQAFPPGRVIAVWQRGWIVVMRVLTDADGMVRLSELVALARGLDVDPACVSVIEAGRGVVEVHVDLDHQAPARIAKGSATWRKLDD